MLQLASDCLLLWLQAGDRLAKLEAALAIAQQHCRVSTEQHAAAVAAQAELAARLKDAVAAQARSEAERDAAAAAQHAVESQRDDAQALLAELRRSNERLASDVDRLSTDVDAARAELGEASSREAAMTVVIQDSKQERDALAVDMQNAVSAREGAVAAADAATAAAESASAAAHDARRKRDSLAHQLEVAHTELETAAQQAAAMAADAHIQAVLTQQSITGARQDWTTAS